VRSGWTYPLLGMVAAMVLGAPHARAQTVALATGNSFSFDGLTYTIGGCQYALAAVGQSGCGPAGAELAATGSGRNAAIEILDSNANTPLLSLASTAGQTYSDITVNLSVTASSSGRTVTSVTDTLAGTGVSGYPTQVSAAVGSSNPNFNLTTSLSQLTDTASFAAYNPTTAAPLTLSVDLKVSTMPDNGGNVGTLTLTSATIQAPEPASLAVFGLALAFLAVARRAGGRSQRNPHPPRPRIAA
jgi:hypothetical protein